VPESAALRNGDVAFPIGPFDAQLPFVEIDVLILERHHLAPPQACFSASKTIN
jgi:hypothetical protein